MSYDLVAIESHCRSNGMRCDRTSADELRVVISKELELRIANTDAGTDTYFGFADGTWHTHGLATIMTGEDTYVELAPLEVLRGLMDGTLLIGSRYLSGVLEDRWLFHRIQKQDFQHIELGETIVIQARDSPRHKRIK